MAAQQTIPIAIADILIELHSPLSADDLGITQRLGPFFRQLAAPAAQVALHWQESRGAPVPRGTLVYDPGAIWRLYRAGDACEAEITYHDDRQPMQMRSVLRANAGWDDLTLVEQRSIPTGRPRGATWHSALATGAGELILRTAIISAGGLVLHACGVDDGGCGIVFVGHSGAGKSTQAGLWSAEPGVIAMNDDRIAVRVDARGVTCHGTPWGGTANIARNHAAPLRAIVLLEQAPDNRLEQLTPAAAAPLLAARAFLPYWDAALLRHALAHLDAIMARTPLFRLRCRPEKAVIPLVRAAL